MASIPHVVITVPAGKRKCRAPKCPAKNKSNSSYCSKHTARLSRTGRLDLRPRAAAPERVLTREGYVRVVLPAGHPLRRTTRPSERNYEHRIVLHDAIGPGTHPCGHCSKPVTWGTTLEVDHLDRNRTNNARSNLVPCCHSCNNRRRRGCIRLVDIDAAAVRLAKAFGLDADEIVRVALAADMPRIASARARRLQEALP